MYLQPKFTLIFLTRLLKKAAKGSPLATFKKAKNPQKVAVDAMNCSDKDDDLSD